MCLLSVYIVPRLELREERSGSKKLWQVVYQEDFLSVASYLYQVPLVGPFYRQFGRRACAIFMNKISEYGLLGYVHSIAQLVQPTCRLFEPSKS